MKIIKIYNVKTRKVKDVLIKTRHDYSRVYNNNNYRILKEY